MFDVKLELLRILSLLGLGAGTAAFVARGDIDGLLLLLVSGFTTGRVFR